MPDLFVALVGLHCGVQESYASFALLARLDLDHPEWPPREDTEVVRA